jgi:hypothetical protein
MADTTTAVSPLRRRMIDDMMLRNLLPATERSYFTPSRSSVAFLDAHRTGLGSRMSGHFRSISCRRGFPGHR